MGKDLLIGRFGVRPYETEIAAHLNSAVDDLSWRGAADEIEQISLLNGASVSLFLDHASRHSGDADPMARFDQLPWWENSLCLPLEFSPGALLRKTTDPTFVGSCQFLLVQLNELRAASRLKLDQPPSGYDDMRKDLSGFYQTDFQLDDEGDIIRWVWHALFDGATEAVSVNAPLWAGPE